VVRARPAAVAQREREARLRALLEPVALAARQLGLSDREAVELFGAVLTEMDVEAEQRR
jgi:hypothetical protein